MLILLQEYFSLLFPFKIRSPVEDVIATAGGDDCLRVFQQVMDFFVKFMLDFHEDNFVG